MIESKYKCEMCDVEIIVYEELKKSYIITITTQYPIEGYQKYLQKALFVRQPDNTYKAYCKNCYKSAYKNIYILEPPKPIEFYHVTERIYCAGESLNMNEETYYFIEQGRRGNQWIDLFLNGLKPENAPERQYSFFAFDNLDNCKAFWENEKRNGFPKYYKVSMQNAIKAPMCLVQLILREGRESNRIETIAREYWNPQHEWKFLEFLSNEMTIIQLHKSPSITDNLAGITNYEEDKELMELLF